MSALFSLRRRRIPALVAGSGLVLTGTVFAAGGSATGAAAASASVIVSEVYGGGGNSGAPYLNDYVELTNLGTTPVDVTGWSVQYASASGTSWANKINLSGTIAPGQAYLAQGASGDTSGQPLPPADATGGVNLSATSGKVAVVSSTTSLTCATGCATAPGVVDFVGYGAANDAETAPAPAGSNTTSVTRTDPTKDTDDNATEFAAVAPTPKALTTTPPPPPPSARIHEIQGAAHRSPLAGTKVGDVTGVVIAKTSNGFWFEDSEPDADPATSEGLFVFTSSAPAVSVGDAVSVVGTVSEFRPGGSGGTNNLSTTELTNPVVTVTGTADLPAPVIVSPGGRVPPSTVIEDDAAGNVETSGTFDPDTDGIDFWESMEGMRIGIDNPSVTGPTSSFGEVPIVAAGASVRTTRGGIVLQAADSNPERLLTDDVLAPAPAAKTGDTLAGTVTGVLDYSFSNFKLQLTVTPAVVDGRLQRETTVPAGKKELSVATFNVENLDPADGPAKFGGLAAGIVHNLASPDILALEEVQDNDGPVDSGTVDADVTLNTLVDAIRAAGGPSYAWRQINPVDDQDGGEPGGNIRVAFLFRTDRKLVFVDRPGGDSTTPVQVLTDGGVHLSVSPGRVDPANPAWAATRKPLAAEFRWKDRPVFVVANHFSSKGGDQPLWGRFQPPVRSSEPKRHEQAQVVRGFVDQILTADPHANVVVLGDLNDFDFSQTADILVGSGTTQLTDLPRTLPAPERYSYVFEGNSQVLDHILLSPNVVPDSSYDIVHMNSEFPDQISDHDPQVVRVAPRAW
jgi:hypothetical protein